MPPDADRDMAVLFDLAHAARLALRYVHGMSLAAFRDDERTQDAVVRRLTILGEAAKRASRDLKASHPTLPWKQMAGMRDIMVHDYERVDLTVVWNVLQNELPSIVTYIDGVLDT